MMKYTSAPYSNVFYATTLRKRDGLLKWDTGKGGATLVIQGKFGEDIMDRIDKICEKLSTMELSARDGFVSLSPELPYMSVRLMDAQQKAKEGGCLVRGEVCRYTILACKMTEDGCQVFEAGKKQAVDVPAEIGITGAKVYDKFEKGLFRKKLVEEFAGFYEIRVEGGDLPSYRDGDICYLAGEIKIPMTARLLKEGLFYVKTEKMPLFQAVNDKGYHLTVSERE